MTSPKVTTVIGALFSLGLVVAVSSVNRGTPPPAPGAHGTFMSEAKATGLPLRERSERGIEQWGSLVRRGLCHQEDPFVLGYAIVRSKGEDVGGGCSDQERGSPSIREILEKATAGGIEGQGLIINLAEQRETRARETGKTEIALLLEYSLRYRKPVVQRLHLRRLDQPFDRQNRPLIWLGNANDEESVAYLAALLEETKDGSVRGDMVFALWVHESTQSVVPILGRIARKDGDHDVREKAIFWLGQTKGGESLNLLGDLLRETDTEGVREKVVFAISQHGGDAAVRFLAETAETNPDIHVRKHAVFWLGQMATKKSLHVLENIAERSDDTEIREHAVFAISQRSTDEAVPLLIKIATYNRSPEVRKKAIFWLGQTGDPRAIHYFQEILLGKE